MLRVEVADVTADWAVVGEPLGAGESACAVAEPADLGATRGRRSAAARRRTPPSTRRSTPGRSALGARCSCRAARLAAVLADVPLAGHLGGRGAAGRGLAPAAGPRDRPPDHPARGRLAAHGRAPAQGLLPRAGDGRPGAQPRPAAAPAGLPAPRRLGAHAAGARRPRCCSATAQVGLRHDRGPAPRARARSRSPWSSARRRSTPPLVAGGIAAAQEVVVAP